MSERSTLILLSAIAAIVVAAPFGWFYGVLSYDSESTSPNDMWIGHALITLPAMIAVAASAWWHSRGPQIVDFPDGTLSSRVAGWSFPIFALIVTFILGIRRAIFVDRIEGIFGDLAFMSMAIMIAVLIAFIILFLPALFVEYTVVRLVRSKRMRAVLSGVES